MPAILAAARPLVRRAVACCGLGLLTLSLGLGTSPVLAQAAGGCTHELRLSRGNWPPYLFGHENGPQQGLDAEILQALMQESGCRLRWVEELPRRRRMMLLREGEIDLVPAATPKPGPTPGLRYTRPYRDEVMGVLALRSLQGRALPAPAARLSSFEDLLRTRTPLLVLNVAQLGPEFEPWRARLREAGLIELFESHNKGMAMLQRHRAPLILGDLATLLDLARQGGVELQQLPFGTQRAPVAFVLSEKSVSEADAQALDQALGRLEARGTLREIRRRYGLE